MLRIPRLARLAGVCALALSALAIGVAPADAVTTSPQGAAGGPSGTFDVSTAGKVTLTYDGFAPLNRLVAIYSQTDTLSCPNPGGVAITPDPLYTVSPLGASPVTISVGTAVKTGFSGAAATLPAGSYVFCLFDAEGGSENQANLITSASSGIYDPVTSSFTTNSDGTITLTYANANYDFGQSGVLLLASGVTECPPTPQTIFSLNGFIFGFGNGPTAVVADVPSGTVIGVGTLGQKTPISSQSDVGPTPVTGGNYHVCLYQSDGEGSTLHQSATFDLGAGPVQPAFTG